MRIFKILMSFLLILFTLSGIASAQSLKAWMEKLPGNRLYLRPGVYFSYGTDTQTIVHSTVIRDVATGKFDFTNVPAKSSWTVYSQAITTATLEAMTPIQQASIAQIVDFARNIQIRFTVYKATNSMWCPFLIEGIDAKGDFAYETIIASNTTANIGNVAWLTISTITPGAVSFASTSLDLQQGVTEGNITLDIGTHDNIGFAVNISTSSDVYACKYNGGATVPTTLTYDHVYDTWHDLSNAPNGTIDWIFYALYNSAR